MAQSIEAFVGSAMDDARMTPIHWRVLALVAAGYFFDVLDLTILGALVPDMIKSGFITAPQVAVVGSSTLVGLLIGCVGEGEFTDRFGRKAVYQFNLLLYALATMAAAFSPNFIWLAAFRFIAGVGLGAEQPLCFSYTAEYAPKNIRGRILALMQLIGGAFPWPVGILLALGFRETIGWRGIWIVIGIGALIVFVLRFSLPESPRWLATHGQGQRALDLLKRMNLTAPPLETLTANAASDTKSDPIAIVFRQYPRNVIASMICFFAFFGIANGLGTWLPNIMAGRGFTITKSLTFTLAMTIAYPCSSAFMMFALERFGRIRTAVPAFVARRAVRRGVRHGAVGGDACRRRLRDVLLHPIGRELDADFRLRGVPDQRACFRFRLCPFGRSNRRCDHRPWLPRHSNHLGGSRGIRHDRGHAGGGCRGGDADRLRDAWPRPRRDRAADGMKMAASRRRPWRNAPRPF